MKKHKVETLKDILNLANKDNVHNLAEDFKIWLEQYTNTVTKIREMYPEETKDKTNTQIVYSKLEWIDDGKTNLEQVNVIH